MPAVGQPPPTPTPTLPSCSECTTKTQAAGGAPATQSPSRIWRSSDGKTRLDTPVTSIITDPLSKQTVVLDHAKKEASIFPMSPASAGAAASNAAQPAAAASQAPAMQVEDLGKSMIEGHEVEGKRYTLPHVPPPLKPPLPEMKVPGTPSIPKIPQAPKPAQPPKLPPVPNVTELWTSVKLKVPVLTKVTTAAGEQTTYCKPTSAEEPHPSVFQIPAGYKIKSKT